MKQPVWVQSDVLPDSVRQADEQISAAVLIGDTAAQLQDTLARAGFENVVMAGYDFARAIAEARRLAVPGGNVLLSPACASFDMFTDYENRGMIFKQIVNGLESEQA